MHNIVLERLYLINLGRKQKNPSTLHHTVKVKFAEFEVIYCMGWLMWFGAKRHFLPGSIDAQYCSGAFIFNKSWQKTKKNPSTLHHTARFNRWVKAKFAEFEVIYCMGWLMWFGAKRHFLPGSIDAQYCSGAFIFNKSWQKTKKSFNSSPYRQGQICRIWSNILYGMTDVVWRKKTFFFFFFFFFLNWKRMRWL